MSKLAYNINSTIITLIQINENMSLIQLHLAF